MGRGRAPVWAVMTLSASSAAVLKLLGARGRAGHSFCFFALQPEFVIEVHVFLKYLFIVWRYKSVIAQKAVLSRMSIWRVCGSTHTHTAHKLRATDLDCTASDDTIIGEL